MRPRSTLPLHARAALFVIAAGAAAHPARRAGAQLAYDHTTLLHGIGSSDAIWKQPYGDLGSLTTPQYLSRQVDLKTVGAPYLNLGAPGRPDSTAGLRYADQRNNLVQFLGAGGGQHVLVAHSLGSLVARGAQGASPQRVAGILTVAAPHQGAPIADNVKVALQYVESLQGAIRDVQNGVRGIGEFFQILGTLTLSPAALIIGNQYVQGSKGAVQFPTQDLQGLGTLEALKDLGPDAGAVQELNAYRGDGGIPRANIRGSIPIENALLRLAAASGRASFDDLKRAKDKGLHTLKKCSSVGFWTLNLLAPGGRCQRAAGLLSALDGRWAAYVNGTEPGVIFRNPITGQIIRGQVPRRVPFDGIVPNERSNYPTATSLVADITVSGASHQDIYKTRDGLNNAANALLRLGMSKASTLTTSLTGPTSFSSAQTLTWTATPAGGDGSYAYQWSYRPSNSTVWYNLGNGGASASRAVDETTPSFSVSVTVTSAGQTATGQIGATNTGSGGGCVPRPGGPPCAQ